MDEQRKYVILFMQDTLSVIHFPKQSNPTTKKRKREQKRAFFERIGGGW